MAYGKQAHTGKYTPKNPQKYVGNIHNIVYRSSLERLFMIWCDSNSQVLLWNSESMVIKYVSPLDEKPHRYFVDFLIKIKNKEGKEKVYLIEVKPMQFTKEPKPGKRQTKHFLAEAAQWQVNQAKWAAAKQFCKERGWEFMIITEKDLPRV